MEADASDADEAADDAAAEAETAAVASAAPGLLPPVTTRSSVNVIFVPAHARTWSINHTKDF